MNMLALERSFGSLNMAAWFTAASAVLHLISVAFLGLAGNGTAMLIMGGLFALFAFGLLHGWRKLSYLVFIALLFGATAAWALTGDANTGLNVTLWLIVLANLGAALNLFANIWRRH